MEKRSCVDKSYSLGMKVENHEKQDNMQAVFLELEKKNTTDWTNQLVSVLKVSGVCVCVVGVGWRCKDLWVVSTEYGNTSNEVVD